MNDEQYFLANSYLDGELTDEERRIAEADPEVMAEVDQLRALRDDVRAVPPPSGETRDAAVAAAMAEFAPAAMTPVERVEPVVPARPRPVAARYLAIAAALVAVAGLGIVVSQADFGGGDDDVGGDDASVAEAPLAESAARPETEEATAESTAEEAAAEMSAESAPASAGAAQEDAGGDVLGADAAEADAADEALGDAESEPAAPEFGVTERVRVPADFDPDAPILNEVALAIYGSYLLELIDLETLGATPETVCSGNYDILATAVYVLDGDARDVYVGVNEDDGFVAALDVDTCTELALGRLF